MLWPRVPLPAWNVRAQSGDPLYHDAWRRRDVRARLARETLRPSYGNLLPCPHLRVCERKMIVDRNINYLSRFACDAASTSRRATESLAHANSTPVHEEGRAMRKKHYTQVM